MPVRSSKSPGEKNPAAVALGKLGGAKGGPARAAALSPAKRKAIAQKAARARWDRKVYDSERENQLQMKTLPITTDKAPAQTRSILKGLPQNLDGQFSADKVAPEKRIHVFQALGAWCEGLNAAQPKLAPIPVDNLPTNIRPIIKSFHENLQAAYTPLASGQRTDVITCIEEWCTANLKVLADSATGKGAGA